MSPLIYVVANRTNLCYNIVIAITNKEKGSKTMKHKLVALVTAAMLLLALCAPAMAAEGPAVITGIEYRAEDANYVDSALYSQVETVTFSDGSSQSIDAAAQTFVLVKDGAVVDLADEANWTEDAELYVIDKSQSDSVMMSMNSANFGDFWFTGVVDWEDGYKEESSVPASSEAVIIKDDGIAGGVINTNADYVSAVYVYNESAEPVVIDTVTFNAAGLGGNDFGTNGCWGGVITAAGNSVLQVKNSVINTEGPLHDGIWAGGSSVVDVYDTVVFAKEEAAKYDFEPYSYDKYVITEAPLSEEEIAALGLSGEVYSEDYESMFGSGTKYYYTNDAYTSNWSAPMLQCVPLALGLYGSMRATCCYGQGTLSFYDSLVVSDVWAVLSTDSGSGTLNATDTLAVIGVQADPAEADLVYEVNGVEYGVNYYGTDDGCGYVTYCDGFDDNFYGCQFYAPDYLAILTGGTFDFTASEARRGFGRSDRIGFMSHGQAYTANLSASDFEVGDAFYSVMSTGAVNITVDDITVDFIKDNSWGGVLFQFMDTDDTGTDANDMEMDVVDLTFEEYKANTPSSEGSTKTLTIKNSTLTGDIWNSTGSSNNASTLAAYDGSTNVLSSWSTSTVALTLDNATLTGAVSTSYAQHVDAEGNPIEGQFFFNKTGEPIDGTAANTYDYLAARRVANTPAYNGIGKIDVTLVNGAVWNVVGECIINSLTVEDGCVVNGTVTENADGTLTVTGETAAAPAAEGGEDLFSLYIDYMKSQLNPDGENNDEFAANLDAVTEETYDETAMPFEMFISNGALGYEDFCAYYTANGTYPAVSSF